MAEGASGQSAAAAHAAGAGRPARASKYSGTTVPAQANSVKRAVAYRLARSPRESGRSFGLAKIRKPASTEGGI